jgi:predicted nucleotidyltransferase
MKEIDFPALLRALSESGVEFIVVGGVAAVAHGSARITFDLDVVYRRTQPNIERLATSLAAYSPYLRGAPPGLPFRFDAETIQRGLNFTLSTTLGPVDLLGEITGGGGYEDLLPNTIAAELFGFTCRCLGLRKLIETKRAAGRPKDSEAIAELERLLSRIEGADR